MYPRKWLLWYEMIIWSNCILIDLGKVETSNILTKENQIGNMQLKNWFKVEKLIPFSYYYWWL